MQEETGPLGDRPPESATAPLAGTVQSLHRGLQILDMIVQAQEPMRLAEIARMLEMDRASAFRLLQTLERNGLVAKDPLRKNYTVGGRLLQWVSMVGESGSLVATARPYLEQLVERTNESGHIGVLSRDRALLLDYIGSRGTIVVQNRVGVFEPLHCTALGKALLAFQPDSRRAVLLAQLSLERHTRSTIVNRKDLAAIIGTVRTEAVAYDNGEYDEMLYCVAAPVLGRDGTAIGAIGVSMVRPIAVEAPRHVEEVAMEVRKAARAMTASLGGEDVARAVFTDVPAPGSPPSGRDEGRGNRSGLAKRR